MRIVWIGNKFSDIKNCNNFFSNSINLYGPNNSNTYSFNNSRLSNNLHIVDADNYINTTAMKLVAKYSDVVFMFYNQSKAFSMNSEIKRRTICINSKLLLDVLNNKALCHELFSDLLNFAPYITLFGRNISKIGLKAIFNNEVLVIQDPTSAGGLGSHILYLNNMDKKIFLPNKLYLISSYIHNNIAFNVHLLITKNSYISFPPSIQLINITKEGNFIFRGSDFINTSQINQKSLDLNFK